MADPKRITESPRITDTVLFDLTTTDTTGVLEDPFRIDKVSIFYLTRDFSAGNPNQRDIDVETLDNVTLETFFSIATVVKVFGTDDTPAWLSTDADNSQIEETDFGTFELLWEPEFARAGDYILCYTWTLLPAGDKISDFFSFQLAGDTRATTVIPTHFTDPEKYPTLLERHLPEYLKIRLGADDLTPETLDKLNGAIGDGFVVLEDMANQVIDLLDANAIHERLILLLSNLFNLVLRTESQTLWRRQIKQAIPLFKRKGTLGGLEEALSQARIKLNSITRLWQVVSPFTWQESFTIIADETVFDLAKTVSDTTDFEIFIRPEGDDDYITLTTDYASIAFDDDDCVYRLTWTGETAIPPISLEPGDIIRVIYKVAPITDSALEDKINALPLADTRDEVDVTFPPKNWNVRLIEETDPEFDVCCPTRHPFRDPLVFGQVRTEFGYSENIYNMEEYNGSLRNSNDPCDLAIDFIDDCSCCQSSKFNIDIEIQSLSTSRMTEARDIIDEFKPFHAIVHNLICQGGIDEVVPPSMEEVIMLVQCDPLEVSIQGQDLFTRVREDGLLGAGLPMTATAPVGAVQRGAPAIDRLTDLTLDVATGIGTGVNSAVTLYSPGIRFDAGILPLDVTANFLEILSGTNAGEYEVENPDQIHVEVIQGSPDTISFPLDTAEFPFRLSNEHFDGSIDSIDQEDIFSFSDENNNFRLSNAEAGWKIEVTAPAPVVGTFIIDATFPDDSVTVTGWPGTTDLTGISYQLKTPADVDVGDPSTTGEMDVTRRGRVDGGTDFQLQFQNKEGDFLLVGGVQYLISEFINDDEFYILGWTGGSVGVTAAKSYRRILDNVTGFLGVIGMVLTTAADHEAGLSISNGGSALGPLLENNQFKENFMVRIDDIYYQIADITGVSVTIIGPLIEFGTAPGTGGIDYAFDHFEKKEQVLTSMGGKPVSGSGETEFSLIDRRNGDYRTVTIDTGTSMTAYAAMHNSAKSGGIYDAQSLQEGVSVEIEWKES